MGCQLSLTETKKASGLGWLVYRGAAFHRKRPLLLFGPIQAVYLVPKKPPDIAIGGLNYAHPSIDGAPIIFAPGLGAYQVPKKPPDIAIGG